MRQVFVAALCSLVAFSGHAAEWTGQASGVFVPADDASLSLAMTGQPSSAFSTSGSVFQSESDDNGGFRSRASVGARRASAPTDALGSSDLFAPLVEDGISRETPAHVLNGQTGFRTWLASSVTQ